MTTKSSGAAVAGSPASNPLVTTKVRRAPFARRLPASADRLAASGKLKGARTERLSARVDPGLIKAARTKTGFKNDSELVNAALAVLAAPDDFGPWFAAQAGRLPKDFELEL